MGSSDGSRPRALAANFSAWRRGRKIASPQLQGVALSLECDTKLRGRRVGYCCNPACPSKTGSRKERPQAVLELGESRRHQRLPAAPDYSQLPPNRRPLFSLLPTLFLCPSPVCLSATAPHLPRKRRKRSAGRPFSQMKTICLLIAQPVRKQSRSNVSFRRTTLTGIMPNVPFCLSVVNNYTESNLGDLAPGPCLGMHGPFPHGRRLSNRLNEASSCGPACSQRAAGLKNELLAFSASCGALRGRRTHRPASRRLARGARGAPSGWRGVKPVATREDNSPSSVRERGRRARR